MNGAAMNMANWTGSSPKPYSVLIIQKDHLRSVKDNIGRTFSAFQQHASGCHGSSHHYLQKERLRLRLPMTLKSINKNCSDELQAIIPFPADIYFFSRHAKNVSVNPLKNCR